MSFLYFEGLIPVELVERDGDLALVRTQGGNVYTVAADKLMVEPESLDDLALVKTMQEAYK